MHGVGGILVNAVLALIDELSASSVMAAAGLLVVLVAWFAWTRTARWKREAKKCRTTLDSIVGPVIVTDSELRILDSNKAARTKLGLGKKRRRNEGLLTVIGAEERQTVESVAEQLRSSGTASFETEIQGGKEYVRARLKTMEVDGRARVVASLENITEERKEAEQYESFIDYIIQHAPVEISILAPDGRYLYLSSSLITDQAQQKWLIGKTDLDYCRESGLHIEFALRRRGHRMEAIDRKESVFFEEDIVIDGVHKQFAWQYCPFVNDDGEVTMVLGFGVDRTEVNTLSKELDSARAEWQKATRLKEALLQNVSHEIRTPLSGIIATAKMLQPEVSQETRDFLKNIEENGHRLSETLTHILDLAGLQAENLDVRPEILNLATEVEQVARSVQHTIDHRGLFLKYSAAQPEILVRADRVALSRCIKSLVDNAVKFTSEGGILLDVSQSHQYAYVRVMDTGVGIDMEAQPDVFEAFTQEEEGTDRAFEGVGLGLTVARKLLSMMDGDIRVHSRKGAGSSFVVRLPLVMQELKRRSSLKSRILIADAQRESHRMITHMLGDYFDFESAHSLAEAAALSGQRQFEAVFVDVGLDPDVDTYEVLRNFREAPNFQEAAFVLIDQHRVNGRRAETLDEGWDDYVSKPLQKLELLNVLYAHTGHAAPVM